MCPRPSDRNSRVEGFRDRSPHNSVEFVRATRNTKIAARPSVRSVKVYVEAYGCTQNYGEARLMQEALRGSGHTITTEEADADAHVLVTCTVVETTERKMARRMTELAAYEK